MSENGSDHGLRRRDFLVAGAAAGIAATAPPLINHAAIARAAKVGPATVYRNFTTKERIVLWDEYDPRLVQGVAERLPAESVIEATRAALVTGLNAIYKRDPVFILGQSTGVLIYSRNLYFIHRRKPPAGEGGQG